MIVDIYVYLSESPRDGIVRDNEMWYNATLFKNVPADIFACCAALSKLIPGVYVRTNVVCSYQVGVNRVFMIHPLTTNYYTPIYTHSFVYAKVLLVALSRLKKLGLVKDVFYLREILKDRDIMTNDTKDGSVKFIHAA